MYFSALDGYQDMLSAGTLDIVRLRADAKPLLTQLDEFEQLQPDKVLPLPAGMWNALYRLDPSGVAAKLSAGDNALEINFLRKAGELSLPVPQVFNAGRLKHATLQNVTF